jgi:hypothetical protein
MCGRQFGKAYLGTEEMRRAYSLPSSAKSIRTRVGYGVPTFKQAKRVMWNRLKGNIPEDWIQGRPNNAECVMQMKTGHVMRVVGLKDPHALRGSVLRFFLRQLTGTTPSRCCCLSHDGIATRTCRCAPSKISATPRAPASTTASTLSHSSSRRLDCKPYAC